MIPALELRRVFAGFSTPNGFLPVLEGLSLTVEKGEWVSVVGPSGCGKTTMLRICAGLLRPQSGEVRVFGKAPRGLVAYMPQGDSLLPWRTALGNVLSAREADGRVGQEARKEAMELLSMFGLAEFAQTFPHELSGGMRQRIALLRTFFANRDLLLLDEPLGALDALTRAELQDWLFQVWQRLRKTVVLVTHDVEEAVILSDRVTVLTPRPARVAALFPIDLPRPRERSSPQVQALRTSILQALAESRKAHEKQG